MSRPHAMLAAVLPAGPVVQKVQRELMADRSLLFRIGRIVVRCEPIASAGRQPFHQPAALEPSQIPLHATQLQQLD